MAEQLTLQVLKTSTDKKYLSKSVNEITEDLAEKMTTIIEQYLGAGKKITEATPAQQDLVEAALAELKEL